MGVTVCSHFKGPSADWGQRGLSKKMFQTTNLLFYYQLLPSLFETALSDVKSSWCYPFQNALRYCGPFRNWRAKQQPPPLASTQTELQLPRTWGCAPGLGVSIYLFCVFLAHFKLTNPTNLAAGYRLRAPGCSQCRLATLLVKYQATHAALCLSPSSLVGMQYETGRAVKRQKNKRFIKTGRETAQKEKQQFLHFQLLLTLLPVHVQLGEDGEPVICQAYLFTNLPEDELGGQNYFAGWNFNSFSANLK